MSNSTFYRPSPPFEKIVLTYLIIEDNTSEKFENQSISVYPNGLNALGFNYGEPTSYTDQTGKLQKLQNGSFLVGTQEHIYKIYPTIKQQEFVIIFKPNVLAKLLRTAMYTFTNGVYRMDFCYKEEQEICEKLKNSVKLPDKVSIVENWLAQKLKCLEIHNDLTSHIVSEMHKNLGDVRIENLCQTHKINRKYLERKFLENIGITPKKYADVIKLKALLRTMATIENSKWKEVYTENGFTDYSHLSKYIQKMTGYKPHTIKEKLEHLSDYIITKNKHDALRDVFILRDGNS